MYELLKPELNGLIGRSHSDMRVKGWHEGDELDIGGIRGVIARFLRWMICLLTLGGAPTAREKLMRLALVTSELDEAMISQGFSDEEYADAILRITDAMGACKRQFTCESLPVDDRIASARDSLVRKIRRGTDNDVDWSRLLICIWKQAFMSDREFFDIIYEKMAFNRTRPHRHGNLKA